MKKSLFLSFALVLVLVSLCHSDPQAADDQIETLMSLDTTVDGENAGGSELQSEDADAYSVRYLSTFSDGGRFSWGFGIERLELTAVDGGAYALQGLLRVEAGPPLIGVHATGGFGLMISDVQVVEREVVTEVTDSESPSDNHVSVSTTTSSVEQTEQETGGLWHLEAGLRGAFTLSDRMGWLLAYSVSGPTGEGFLVDSTRGLVFALTIPTGGQP